MLIATRPAPADLLAALTTGETATAVLARLYGQAPRAVKQPGPAQPMPPALAALLGPGLVVHRRIDLMLGPMRALTADLWFLPDRLWPGMARRLAETDTPFGAVIAPMSPRRETLAARRPRQPAPFIFEIDAVVRAGADALAVARERYDVGLVEKAERST